MEVQDLKSKIQTAEAEVSKILDNLIKETGISISAVDVHIGLTTSVPLRDRDDIDFTRLDIKEELTSKINFTL